MSNHTWNTGLWRNCFHFNPREHSEPNTEREMSSLAKAERRYDILWGVVNSGNALCVGVFRTKREATDYRRQHASAYSVVRVIVTPIYTSTLPIEQSLLVDTLSQLDPCRGSSPRPAPDKE